MKSKARNGCDGRLMDKKKINNDISGAGGNIFTYVAVIKKPLTYHLNHFLTATFDFTTFHFIRILKRATLSFTAYMFWYRYILYLGGYLSTLCTIRDFI